MFGGAVSRRLTVFGGTVSPRLTVFGGAVSPDFGSETENVVTPPGYDV